ncbi:MAG: DUF3783 domain-containing protein [Deltaproteobacteria bacterium]|nr:DUF3783 domain-containing protein [Deltaproteobacteria bacterium]
MTTGEFEKLGETENTLYGPRFIISCGFTGEQKQFFMNLNENTGVEFAPVVFPGPDNIDEPMENLLKLPHGDGIEKSIEYPPVVILSGLKESELHQFMKRYREAAMPSPLFAVLTQFSEKWPFSYLVKHLVSEYKEMHEKRNRKE